MSKYSGYKVTKEQHFTLSFFYAGFFCITEELNRHPIYRVRMVQIFTYKIAAF